jgi:hypothetical protein
MTTKSVGWAKLFGELLVVFAGVLIALWADAWWEDREARHRLRDNLATVAEDMAAARSSLAAAISADSSMVAHLAELGTALAETDTAAVLDAYERFPGVSIQVPPLRLGTLQYLVSSGDLRLAQDLRTQAELIEGRSLIELFQGFNNDLATDARRALERWDQAEAEARLAGVEVPVQYMGDAGLLGSLITLQYRIANIERPLRRIQAQAGEIESVARDAIAG